MVPTAHRTTSARRAYSVPLAGEDGSSSDFQTAERRRGRRARTTGRDFGAPLIGVIPSGPWTSLYGARPEARLTMRTPEQVSPREGLGADAGAADQARLAGAAVDVHLAAVVVVAG